LNSHITWVIVTREGHPLKLDKLKSYKTIMLDAEISSTDIREYKDLYYVDKKIKKSVKDILEGNK
jgi:nicotinate-nucleotide adenylyltransferase